MKRIAALICSLCSLFYCVAEPQFGAALDIIGFTLTGHDLAKSGYFWADNAYLENVPLIPIAVPSFSVEIKKAPPKERKPALFSTNYRVTSTFSFMGISAGSEVSASITPLFTLSANANISSSWNYGTSIQTIGLYNAGKKKYDSVQSLSEAAYMIGGRADAVIPLGIYIVRLSYGSTYAGFTGAADKEVWKCAQMNAAVNGWKYRGSCMFARRFTGGKLKTISLMTSAEGWYSEDYFADVYQPYNPGFVTWSIMPSAQFQLTPKQSLMVNAIISRERSFTNNDYDSGEELLQVYDEDHWRLKSIMFLWHIKLY